MGVALAVVPDVDWVVVVLRHLFQAAGIPALVLLSAVAALVSVGEAFSVLSPRSAGAAGVAVGGGAVGLAAIALGTGGPWGDAALAVGVVTLAAAVAVRTFGERIRFRHLLLATVLATLGIGLLLGPRVEAFGWRRSLGVPVQPFALAFAGVGFLPLGYAGRLGGTARWLLAALVVATPVAVALPTVPVGGLGPLLVGVVLAPWALSAATVGSVLFALGWVACGPRDRSRRPGGDPEW